MYRIPRDTKENTHTFETSVEDDAEARLSMNGIIVTSMQKHSYLLCSQSDQNKNRRKLVDTIQLSIGAPTGLG